MYNKLVSVLLLVGFLALFPVIPTNLYAGNAQMSDQKTDSLIAQRWRGAGPRFDRGFDRGYYGGGYFRDYDRGYGYGNYYAPYNRSYYYSSPFYGGDYGYSNYYYNDCATCGGGLFSGGLLGGFWGY